MFKTAITLALILGILNAGSVYAETPSNLQACLKHTDDMPDIAAAEADAWAKKGGGFQARLCHAFAQFKRQDFLSAAHEFAALAGSIDPKDVQQAASLYAQAGLSFTRAGKIQDAEQEYATALKLNAVDPGIWLDRAAERATTEHYWDAVGDATQALKLNPKNAEALRLRAQIWVKLGNTSKAEDDFVAAEALDPSPVPQGEQ